MSTPTLWLRAPKRMLVAALALAAAGCGPGVGGTGTGLEPPPDIPGSGTATATLAPLCDSPLAPLLRCPAAGTASASLGTALVWLADGNASRNAQARIEGNAVDLELACRGLQFNGTWSAKPGQAARFWGVLRDLAGGTSAEVALAAAPAGTELTLQLLDAQGQPLTDPFAVHRVPDALPAGPCR